MRDLKELAGLTRVALAADLANGIRPACSSCSRASLSRLSPSPLTSRTSPLTYSRTPWNMISIESLTTTTWRFFLRSYQKPISRSKKRPRSVLREEATQQEAVPLTSTPLPGQGTTQRGQQRLPDPSQAGAAPRPTKSAAKDSAGKAVPSATAAEGAEEEETTTKKKKPNRRRTRRKLRQQTETAGEGTAAGEGQAAEPSEQGMDISA